MAGKRRNLRSTSGLPRLLVQHERDKPRAGTGDHILQAVELVGDQAVGHAVADARVPERLTGGGVVGADAAGSRIEKDVAGGAEDAGVSAVARDAPADLPRLVVDRLELRLFGVAAAIGSAPAHGILAGVVDVPDAERPRGV